MTSFDLDEDLPTLMHELEDMDYRLIRRIGSGSEGNVFLVHSTKYKKDFALKATRSSHKTLSNELETLIQLDHPNIIQIYSRFSLSSADCIIFEFCSKGSLFDLIQKDGRFSKDNIYPVCFQLASAIQHMHLLNIAHRDIKPQNILIDEYGRVKLTDFGLAEVYDLERDLNYVGSPPFMAPEIWKKTPNYDPFKADIFSLAITFYFIAAGETPWTSKNHHSLKIEICSNSLCFNKKIPHEFQNLIREMTDSNPDKRLNISAVVSHPIFQSSNTAGGDDSDLGGTKMKRSKSSEILMSRSLQNISGRYTSLIGGANTPVKGVKKKPVQLVSKSPSFNETFQMNPSVSTPIPKLKMVLPPFLNSSLENRVMSSKSMNAILKTDQSE